MKILILSQSFSTEELQINDFMLSDSGTVQEECSIFNVPNVTVRDVTERAETIEAGSNILTGADPEWVLRSMQIVLDTPHEWIPPTFLPD